MAQRKLYQDRAGWKGREASRIAAEAVSKTLPQRQAQIYQAFARYGERGSTSCEIARGLGLPASLVRPRTTELDRLGKLFAIGTRKGEWGQPVTIYTTVRPKDEGTDADG